MAQSKWSRLLAGGTVEIRPIDYLRKQLTAGLDVRAEPRDVRRGEAIIVVASVADPERLGELEVGLVCTALHDEDHSTSDGWNRCTEEDSAYETWSRVPPTAGEHRVAFSVPAHAPFTYEGSCLSFQWEVAARGRRRGLDARATAPLRVHP